MRHLLGVLHLLSTRNRALPGPRYYSLKPDIKVIAPWREWDLLSRTKLIEYAEKNDIPVPMVRSLPFFPFVHCNYLVCSPPLSSIRCWNRCRLRPLELVCCIPLCNHMEVMHCIYVDPRMDRHIATTRCGIPGYPTSATHHLAAMYTALPHCVSLREDSSCQKCRTATPRLSSRLVRSAHHVSSPALTVPTRESDSVRDLSVCAALNLAYLPRDLVRVRRRSAVSRRSAWTPTCCISATKGTRWRTRGSLLRSPCSAVQFHPSRCEHITENVFVTGGFLVRHNWPHSRLPTSTNNNIPAVRPVVSGCISTGNQMRFTVFSYFTIFSYFLFDSVDLRFPSLFT